MDDMLQMSTRQLSRLGVRPALHRTQCGASVLPTKYQGFGPTLAHEKLVEKEKRTPSDESVRKLMIAEGL